MRKIAAIVATLLLASALGHGHKKEAKVTVEVWPDIKYLTLTTFTMAYEEYKWRYGILDTYAGGTGNVLVDSDRNKAAVSTIVGIPMYRKMYYEY